MTAPSYFPVFMLFYRPMSFTPINRSSIPHCFSPTPHAMLQYQVNAPDLNQVNIPPPHSPHSLWTPSHPLQALRHHLEKYLIQPTKSTHPHHPPSCIIFSLLFDLHPSNSALQNVIKRGSNSVMTTRTYHTN